MGTLGVHIWKLLRQHHGPLSNSSFGVSHGVSRRLNPQQLLGPKRLLLTLNGVAGILHDEGGPERLGPSEDRRDGACLSLGGTGANRQRLLLFL